MTVADRIHDMFKDNNTFHRTPVEIANYLGLNANTVRRTTREMFLNGELIEQLRIQGAPAYVLATFEG